MVLDQTRADIEVPVVRVVVPGMRHFYKRFARGRLYDVPVKLGLRDWPTAEEDLNQIHPHTQSMIPKSGYRFSEKDHAQTIR